MRHENDQVTNKTAAGVIGALAMITVCWLTLSSPAAAEFGVQCVDELPDGSCPPCGDGFCDGTVGENCTSCGADCGSCSPCGDGICSALLGEDCATCATDCGICDPCGDGICNVALGEGCGTCAADCGPCTPCGDGLCDPFNGESCATCTADCGPCTTCGDGLCDPLHGESCATCAMDCGPCTTCGDGLCDVGSGETCSVCALDCGPCEPTCEEDCADEPAEVKSMDDIFKRLQIKKYKDGATDKDFTTWLDMVADLDPFNTISANDSDVVRDDPNGKREFYETTVTACNGKTYKVRFTKDSANGASGFEVFVRDVTCDLPYRVGTILALGTNAAGGLVDIVPPILATDKGGNSTDGIDVISPGIGCFQCHPAVSFDYDIAGAETFWGDFEPPDGSQPANGQCKITTTCKKQDNKNGLFAADGDYDASACKNGKTCSKTPPNDPVTGSWATCAPEDLGNKLTLLRDCV